MPTPLEVYRSDLVHHIMTTHGVFREGLEYALALFDRSLSGGNPGILCGNQGPYVPASRTQLICVLGHGHPGQHTAEIGRGPWWTGRPPKPVTESEIKSTVESLLALQQDLETHG